MTVLLEILKKTITPVFSRLPQKFSMEVKLSKSEDNTTTDTQLLEVR